MLRETTGQEVPGCLPVLRDLLSPLSDDGHFRVAFRLLDRLEELEVLSVPECKGMMAPAAINRTCSMLDSSQQKGVRSCDRLQRIKSVPPDRRLPSRWSASECAELINDALRRLQRSSPKAAARARRISIGRGERIELIAHHQPPDEMELRAAPLAADMHDKGMVFMVARQRANAVRAEELVLVEHLGQDAAKLGFVQNGGQPAARNACFSRIVDRRA